MGVSTDEPQTGPALTTHSSVHRGIKRPKPDDDASLNTGLEETSHMAQDQEDDDAGQTELEKTMKRCLKPLDARLNSLDANFKQVVPHGQCAF